MSAESDFIAAVRAATAALVAALAALDANAAPPVSGPPYDVVLVGDSRLAGTDANAKIDWGSLTGLKILNLAVPGSKAVDWIANWQANVQAITNSGAKKVIVQYGKNEADSQGPNFTAASVAHNIQDVVALIQNYTSARVGVLGPIPVTTAVQNASVLNSFINQLQSTVPAAIAAISPPGTWYQGLSAIRSGDALNPAYSSDGSHFNAAGIQAYAPSISALAAAIPSN